MFLVFESLVPVFGLIALGLYLRKSGFVPEEQWKGFETLSFWFFYPGLIFHILVNADLNNTPLSEMTGTLLLVVLIACAIMALAYPVFKHLGVEIPAYTSVYQCVVRWNGFIVLAIVSKLYENDAMALVAIAMAVMIPVLNVIVVAMLSICVGKQTSALGILRQIAKNPLIWASVLGLLVNRFSIGIWDPILTFIEILSRGGLAASLMLIGSDLRLRYAFPPTPIVWAGALLRLLGMPLLTILIAWPMGLRGFALEIAVLCTAVPTAMNGYVLAKKMGGDAPLYAALSTLQTFLSVLTIPFMLAVLDWLQM